MEITEKCAKNMSWAFTYKRLGNGFVLPKDYTQVIKVLSDYGFVDCHFYEKDSLGKLHVHGIVQLRKGFLRKRLAIHGFHCHFEELYDRNGWEYYIARDQNLFDPKFEPPVIPSSTIEECDMPSPFVGEDVLIPN